MQEIMISIHPEWCEKIAPRLKPLKFAKTSRSVNCHLSVIFTKQNAFISNGYHIMNPHMLIRLKNENLINYKRVLKLEEN